MEIICMVLLITLMAGLSINYFIDKKRKVILLNKILSNKINYKKIYITEPDGDGYQYLQVILNKKVITLATHFDIQKTCKILSDNGMVYTGKYIQ